MTIYHTIGCAMSQKDSCIDSRHPILHDTVRLHDSSRRFTTIVQTTLSNTEPYSWSCDTKCPNCRSFTGVLARCSIVKLFSRNVLDSIRISIDCPTFQISKTESLRCEKNARIERVGALVSVASDNAVEVNFITRQRWLLQREWR